MDEKKQPQQTNMGILRDLEVGQHHDFPAEKLHSIKAMCSTFSFQWDRKFTTKIDRVRRVVTVTRTK